VVALIAPAAGSACTGDCSGDLRVTVDELVTCANLGLGRSAPAPCPRCDPDQDGAVSIEELVAAVSAALQDLVVTAAGTCVRPGSGPGGLQPCDAGTSVSLSRCRDRSNCLAGEGARVMLDGGMVGEDGSFSLATCEAVGATLVFEADVDPPSGTTYRVLAFGPVGSGSSSGAGAQGTVPLGEVTIGPRSEAGVRVIEDNGLEVFTNEGVMEILATVEEQTAGIDFSNFDARAAAEVATNVALDDTEVQRAIERNRITPTPTSTGTPTSTPTATPIPTEVNVTSEGTVTASSVFGGDEFPTELAVDGDRRTSWFSDGEAGGPTETFSWTGARDDVLASIAILSNAQHPQFPGFGFGSVQIEVRDAGGETVFGESRSLPGITDPDVTVSPNVTGRSVLLTFTGHDDPACGGFSELVIVALR
jgi:hypothetical protein